MVSFKSAKHFYGDVVIERQFLDDCTIGYLIINNKEFCKTLERPWLENKRNISCIPNGHYYCKKRFSLKFGWCFEVTNVKGRGGILFHAGNIAQHSKGCILLGSNFGVLNSQQAVLQSRDAVKKFDSFFKNYNSFSIVIRNVEDRRS